MRKFRGDFGEGESAEHWCSESGGLFNRNRNVNFSKLTHYPCCFFGLNGPLAPAGEGIQRRLVGLDRCCAVIISKLPRDLAQHLRAKLGRFDLSGKLLRLLDQLPREVGTGSREDRSKVELLVGAPARVGAMID